MSMRLLKNCVFFLINLVLIEIVIQLVRCLTYSNRYKLFLVKMLARILMIIY